eukprot:6739667-Prymnesium_polylepis.1
MDVIVNYLLDPENTIKSAILDGIVKERLKLLLELLEGTITLPHSKESIPLLKEKLRCAAGMRSPGYIENVNDLRQGYTGNIGDGSEQIHRVIRTVHPRMQFYNGKAVRKLYLSEKEKCCLGDEGMDGVFQVGFPIMPILEDVLGSIDTLGPEGNNGEYVTLITFIERPSARVPTVGDNIYNTNRRRLAWTSHTARCLPPPRHRR